MNVLYSRPDYFKVSNNLVFSTLNRPLEMKNSQNKSCCTGEGGFVNGDSLIVSPFDEASALSTNLFKKVVISEKRETLETIEKTIDDKVSSMIEDVDLKFASNLQR